MPVVLIIIKFMNIQSMDILLVIVYDLKSLGNSFGSEAKIFFGAFTTDILLVLDYDL